jgi:hypothetical protein
LSKKKFKYDLAIKSFSDMDTNLCDVSYRLTHHMNNCKLFKDNKYCKVCKFYFSDDYQSLTNTYSDLVTLDADYKDLCKLFGKPYRITKKYLKYLQKNRLHSLNQSLKSTNIVGHCNYNAQSDVDTFSDVFWIGYLDDQKFRGKTVKDYFIIRDIGTGKNARDLWEKDISADYYWINGESDESAGYCLPNVSMYDAKGKVVSFTYGDDDYPRFHTYIHKIKHFNYVDTPSYAELLEKDNFEIRHDKPLGVPAKDNRKWYLSSESINSSADISKVKRSAYDIKETIQNYLEVDK